MNLSEVMRLSWTDELYKVYENNCGRTDCVEVLLPVFHSTANAQIEITLTEDGCFDSARRIEDKSETVTIIPVTESSGSKSSGIVPHPFADKLIYIAGDYTEYTDNKHNDELKYSAYIDQLGKWYDSAYCCKAVEAVYIYLKKSCLISDLVSRRILNVDEETGKLTNEKICGISQCDCFVRFRIIFNDISFEGRTWLDKKLYDSFIAWNSRTDSETQLCYATGTDCVCTYKHPAKIRNSGDKAKLFSTNDENGFKYRGRFTSKEQAVSISYEFSQKMHNGLKWLIQRQGINIASSLTILSWESAMQDIPDITVDSYNFFGAGMEEYNVGLEQNDIQNMLPDTLPAFKSQLNKIIFGYQSKLDINSKIMVMMLDSATTGRLSMTMYDELLSTKFFANLEKWHSDTAWRRFNGKEKRNFIGSFNIHDIAECAYGTEQGNEGKEFIKCKDSIQKEVYSRIIPCIIGNRKFPEDITRLLVNKASRPLSYKKYYNWRRVLETACGFIRKNTIEKKGECEMSLDKESCSRDYLYGRLLAIADAAESSTYAKGEERITNARRYFEAFANRPYQTWDVIYKRLLPYLNKMSEGTRIYYSKMITDIFEKMDHNESMNNAKLKPEYLHAYSCQLSEIYKSNKEEN